MSVKPCRSSCCANGAHPAVHHVAGRDDVRAGLGVAGSGAREEFQSGIVQNRGARWSALHDAAMAVRHVFAKADIGDDQQLRQFSFQGAHRLLHDAVGGVRAGGAVVFNVGNAEEQHCRDARVVRSRGFL